MANTSVLVPQNRFRSQVMPTETIRVSCEFADKLRVIVAALKKREGTKGNSIGAYVEEKLAAVVEDDLRAASQAVAGMIAPRRKPAN